MTGSVVVPKPFFQIFTQHSTHLWVNFSLVLVIATCWKIKMTQSGVMQ